MKKAQIQNRMTKLHVPCDKLSRLPFIFTAEQFADIITNNRRLGCLEDDEKTVTPYWLAQCAECANLKPLDAFHREVLFVLISEYEQGYTNVSIRMTLNAMTGDEKSRVYKEQFEAIESAVRTLQNTNITVDLSALFKSMPNYRKNCKGSARLSGYLLPCHIVDTELNGQKTISIELIAESPLMTVAKIKNQRFTYDTAPLKIPNQNNTPRTITIKNWLLRRVMLSKKRKLSKKILFKSFYEDCGLKDATRSAKQHARNFFFDTLDAFKAEGTINGYDIERGTNNAYRSITIKF